MLQMRMFGSAYRDHVKPHRMLACPVTAREDLRGSAYPLLFVLVDGFLWRSSGIARSSFDLYKHEHIMVHRNQVNFRASGPEVPRHNSKALASQVPLGESFTLPADRDSRLLFSIGSTAGKSPPKVPDRVANPAENHVGPHLICALDLPRDEAEGDGRDHDAGRRLLSPDTERRGCYDSRTMAQSKITPEQVRHVALLARLSLTPDEEDRIRANMDEILGYIDKLNELPTEGIEPTAQVGDPGMPTREDAVTNHPDPEAMLANAPASERGYFKVPKIIE